MLFYSRNKRDYIDIFVKLYCWILLKRRKAESSYHNVQSLISMEILLKIADGFIRKTSGLTTDMIRTELDGNKGPILLSALFARRRIA